MARAVELGRSESLRSNAALPTTQKVIPRCLGRKTTRFATSTLWRVVFSLCFPGS